MSIFNHRLKYVSTKVWDATTGDLCFTLEGHLRAVTGCAISDTGNTIVSDKALSDQDIAVISSDCSDLAVRDNLYKKGL